SIGHLATFSFHETKNIQCGEGGALLVNDDALVERAEIVQEKGTNRTAFFQLEQAGVVQRPGVPEGCEHSGHLYYLLLGGERARDALIAALAQAGVHAVFHYIPLGSSPAGRRYGREPEPAVLAESLSRRLVRLPLWVGMDAGDVGRVVESVTDALTAPLLPQL